MSPRVSGRHYVVSLLSEEGVLHCVAPKNVFPRAVDRNREKRRCRAALRESRGGLLVRVTRATADSPFRVIREELIGLAKRLGRA